MTTQDVMIVLLVASAHLTLASLFDEMPKLKFWLLEEYGKLANGSYEYYLEIKGDRSQGPKKIAEARENATSHFLELDAIVGMHASLTRKRNLFLGSWLTYVTICITIHFSQKKEAAKIRRNRNARIRRENMRAWIRERTKENSPSGEFFIISDDGKLNFGKNARKSGTITKHSMSAKQNAVRTFKVWKISGFTLVELIVVITILAILATIGFLALSGYSQDAKDSAIKANVRSLQTAISSEAAITNNSPRHYVVHDTDYALSGAFAYVDGASVALTGGDVGSAPLDSNYTAGKPDFKKLKLNPDKFRISTSGLPGGTMGVIARATGFGTDSAEASYDASSLMAAGADFMTAGANGKKRVTSYVQTAGVSPATRLASVAGNFPTSNVPAGNVSGLFRAEPGSATNLTGALLDGAAGNVSTDSTGCNASPTVIDYTGLTGSVSVPSGCTKVVAKIWGGGGGGWKSWTTVRLGGGAWYVETGSVPVSWTLYVVVGGGGMGGCIDSTLCNPMGNTPWSFWGGGAAMQGNAWGGWSYLANNPTFNPTSLIAAAGGGGWAGTSTTLTLSMQGWPGGWSIGWDGAFLVSSAAKWWTQSGGGAAAYTDLWTTFAAMSGSYMQWGASRTASNTNYASGGGGGYYGGGCWGRQWSWNHVAGAGGSSYVAGGNGTLTSGAADKPGNQTDAYSTNAGTLFGEGGGAVHNNGNNGRIVLIWGN